MKRSRANLSTGTDRKALRDSRFCAAFGMGYYYFWFTTEEPAP